jgi:hypothetical protein
MTIILPVDPYECEIWSSTLREVHKLRVFDEENIWTEEGRSGGRVKKTAQLYGLRDLYPSLSITGIIKSRRWAAM